MNASFELVEGKELMLMPRVSVKRMRENEEKFGGAPSGLNGASAYN
jgi:hypothetical protein